MPQAPAFSRGERLMQPDLMLLTSIRAGRNAMPGFMGLLSDREILDVISFLRVLQ
jgi:cytochrome c6